MTRPSKARAAFAFLAATLSWALLALSVLPPPVEPERILAWISTHRTAYALFAALCLGWSILSIPFVAVLGALLDEADATLIAAARMLTAAGILLLGAGVFVATTALLALAAVAPDQDPAVTATQVKFWTQMRFYLTDPGLMAWGAGQLLYCGLLWRARKLPATIVAIGFVGGLAGLLTLAVFETPLLALLQLLSFSILAVSAGVALRRPLA